MRARLRSTSGFLVCLFLFSASPLLAQWQIVTNEGKTTLKFGFLTQMRADAADTDDGTAKDLFFRRLRLIAGGSLTGNLSFFFETDSPNLGKGQAGGKNAGDIFIQDFVAMYRWRDDQYIDAGLLLTANSHNTNQSAASLLAVDYGPWSFLASAPTHSRVGRDYGVRARGYVLGDHLEYRAAVYQGARLESSTAALRTLGRVVYNVFEPEKGLFYGGSYLGKKRVLSIGASRDQQDDYSSTALDVFWDQPLAGGNGLTIQADWIRYDGGDFFPQLPEQDALLVEAGWYVANARLLPFVQFAARDFASPLRADQESIQAGVGWMLDGHGRTLKVAWGRLSTDDGDDLDQIMLQFQLFRF